MKVSSLPAPLQGLAKFIDSHPSAGVPDENLTVEEVATALQLGLIPPDQLEAAQDLRQRLLAEAQAAGPAPLGVTGKATGVGSSVGGLRAPAGTAVWPGLVEDDLDDEVDTSLLDEDLTRIGATPSGQVFQLDSATVGAMTVRVRQIKDSQYGPGAEISARLTLRSSRAIAERFRENAISDARLVEYKIEAGEFKEGAFLLKSEAPYVPVAKNGPLKAYRVEEPGRWMLDYVQPSGNPQAYRDKLRVRVFGATDEERDKNLKAAVERCGIPGIIADADSLQMERMRRLSALRMVAPGRADELAATALDRIELSELDRALAEHGVDAARLADIDFEEVFPGHMAAVDPALGETYARLGVRAVMTGVRSLEGAVRILTSDGLLSSTDRYTRGLHRAGASLSADEASGGAEFAFARLVTQKAIDDGVPIQESFGAGDCQLLSVGVPMKALLSRTDWHAYTADSYGVTVSDWQARAEPEDVTLTEQLEQRESQFSSRLVLRELIDAIDGEPSNSWADEGPWRSSNEACFKSGVSSQSFTHVVVEDEEMRTELLQLLEREGLKELGGRPLPEAVLVGKTWRDVGAQLGFAKGTPRDARPQPIAAVDATPGSAGSSGSSS